MCWNAEVSLNTFIFSSFVLLLVAYNNAYTQYKIKEFDNIWVYVFFMSVFVMQLIEFFLWKNLKNEYNSFFTKLAILTVAFQPIAALLCMQNQSLKIKMISAYSAFTSIFLVYKLRRTQTKLTKDGHLNWFGYADNYVINAWAIIWAFFFFFGLLYSNSIMFTVFAAITITLCLYNWYNNYSWGTLWCWIANLIALYYAAYLLIYLPLCEKMC